MPWVRLKTVRQHDIAGKVKTYHPGDWLEVGNQTARRWLAEGVAEIPTYNGSNLLPPGCGLVIRGAPLVPHGQPYAGILEIAAGEYDLAFSRSILWSPAVPLRTELIAAGLHLLDKWQIALPLLDYDTLAVHLGTEADRQHTETVIRDLRVLVYDIRLMFVKRCPDTLKLFELWESERAAGGDERLSFLRAMYRAKPLVLALPMTWVTVGGKDKYDGYGI